MIVVLVVEYLLSGVRLIEAGLLLLVNNAIYYIKHNGVWGGYSRSEVGDICHTPLLPSHPAADEVDTP